jgi:hypothetical protein
LSQEAAGVGLYGLAEAIAVKAAETELAVVEAALAG